MQRVVVLDEYLVHAHPHAKLDPALEAPVAGGARAKLLGECLPLTTRPEHVEHAVENLARRSPGPTARWAQLVLRDHRFDQLP